MRWIVLALSAALLLVSASAHAGGLPIERNPYGMRSLLRPRATSLGKVQRHALADIADGHRLVVVVMKGHWCDVCAQQLKEFAFLRKHLEKLDARVVGLSADSPRANADVMKRHKLPYPVLSDPRHKVLKAMGVWHEKWGHPLPSIIVYDRCGKERGRVSGRRPGMRPEKALLEFLGAIDQKPERCDAPPSA